MTSALPGASSERPGGEQSANCPFLGLSFMEVKTPEQKILPTVDIPAIEVFSEGTWNGDKYDHGDLQAMVDAFDKVGFEPTAKAGHPDGQEDEKKARLVFGAPALGYAKRIWIDGKKLFAEMKSVPKRFADLIKAGAFKRISAEIYWNYKNESNGTTYPRVLKSIAFLGAEIPALTNLEAIESLYEKNATGSLFAYDEHKNEFRLYHMDCAMPMSSGMGMSLSDYLLNYPRKSKENASYQESGDGQEKCGNCKFLIPGFSACSIVEGRIEPSYVSDYFELRSDLIAQFADKQKLKEYTIEKRGEEWCLLTKDGSKVLGCHKTEADALAQEQAVQANKNSQEEGNMTFKTHMTREEISNICAPCGESMKEKGISALTFSDAQVAKFAGMDMKACMEDAGKVKEYPDEGKRKTACQSEMDKAVMESIQESKGGPIMDEKKFEQEKAQLIVDKKAAEDKAKQYQDRLAALEASNEEAKQKETEALAKVKKLERKGYDIEMESWIAGEKRAGRLAPVEEPRLRAIFASLYEDQRTATFSQPDGSGNKEVKESLADAIKTFVSKRPSIFAEMSHSTQEPQEPLGNPGDELNRLTQEYQKKNNVKEYKAAFDAVKNDNPELTQKWLALQQ